MSRCGELAPLLAIVVFSSVASAQDGAERRLERDGLKLELAALTADQTRAFLIGRGFAAKDADFVVATGCVFRSAIGSAFGKAGEPEVTLALRKWQPEFYERAPARAGGLPSYRAHQRWLELQASRRV